MSRATVKMLRSVFSKAFARGKVTNLVTVVVALTLATISPALAANGGNFILGVTTNTATLVTKLTANVAQPALWISNTSTGTGATALRLDTASTKPPMTVNSATKVANLNADRVDGLSFTCPSNTLSHEGVCIEKIGRPPNDFINAQRDCLDEGKRLPSVGELQTFRNRSGQDFPSSTDGEWTSQPDISGSTSGVVTVKPDGDTGWTNSSLPFPRYRCVALPPS